MKEYICKEDLVKAWHEVTNWEDYPLIFSVVEKDIPTITKADICREFAEKLNEKWNINLSELIDSVLEKME